MFINVMFFWEKWANFSRKPKTFFLIVFKEIQRIYLIIFIAMATFWYHKKELDVDLGRK